MYDRDTIELALLALEEGMSQGEAAELAGVARTTVGNWERGRLPHARSEKRAHRRTRPPQRAARMSAPDAKEGPLNEVERAAYEAAMTENMLLRAVLDDLKGAGSHPASMSNRRKCDLLGRAPPLAAQARPYRAVAPVAAALLEQLPHPPAQGGVLVGAREPGPPVLIGAPRYPQESGDL